MATFSNNSGMTSMDIESDGGPRNYMCNRVRGNKNYIIGAIFIVALVFIPLVTYKGGAGVPPPNNNNNSASNDGLNSAANLMSWPPPNVDVEDFDNVDGINTNRERMLLRDDTTSNGIASSGITIRQKVDLKTDNNIHVPTGDIATDLDMEMDDNEIKVSNEGKKIEVTVNHINMSMKSAMNGIGIMDVHYDSNAGGADLDPSFAVLKELIGHTTTIELDDDGNVVRASEHEELYKAMSNGQENADTMKQFSSENQFNQMSRMAKSLPQGELLAPGDDWDFNMQMDAAFRGSAVLLGYKDYDNSDCAVVKLDGTIDFDPDQMDAISNAMTENVDDQDYGDQLNAIMAGTQIKDGKMSAILYWDHEHQLARFSKTVITMTMVMDNPLEPSNKLEVPTEETMITYSSVVE